METIKKNLEERSRKTISILTQSEREEQTLRSLTRSWLIITVHRRRLRTCPTFRFRIREL